MTYQFRIEKGNKLVENTALFFVVNIENGAETSSCLMTDPSSAEQTTKYLSQIS